MLIVPIPLKFNGVLMEETVITMETINWVDNSGVYPATSHMY